MASIDISSEIAAITSAVYGEEVRGSIKEALTKMVTALNAAIGQQVIDREAVDDILSSEALSLKYANYTEVDSAVTDLNVLAGTAANYWIPYAKAQLINNMPIIHAGRLFVFPAKGSGTNDDGGIQLFMSSQNAGNAELWIRGWKGATWKAWQKVATNDGFTDLINSLTYTNEGIVNSLDDLGYVQYSDYSSLTHYDKVPGASDSTALAITRFGTICVLDGGGISSIIRFKMNGSEMQRTISSPTVDSWVEPVALTVGKKYVATLRYLSGGQPSGHPSVSIYAQGTHSTIGNAIADTATEYKREFVYTGTPVHIAVYVPENATYVNAKYNVSLQESEIDTEMASSIPFSSEYAYSIGDMVEYNGAIYAFTASHTGAWNASHVSYIKEAEKSGYANISIGGVLAGYPSGDAIVSNDNTRSVWVKVVENCRYIIRRTIKSSRFRVYFANVQPAIGSAVQTDTVIAKDSETGIDVFIPEGVSYIVVYCSANTSSDRDRKDDIVNGISAIAKSDGDPKAMSVIENSGLVLDKTENDRRSYIIDMLTKDVNYIDIWTQGGLGSHGENFNSRDTSIRTDLFLPVDEYVYVITTNEFTSGYLCLYSSDSEAGFIVRQTISTDSTISIIDVRQQRPTATHFRIEIAGVNGYESEYDRVQLIGLVTAKKSQDVKTVVDLNENNKAKARVLKIQRTSSEGYGNAALSFLFITDVHAQSARMKRCIQLANAWGSDFIQVIVNGGDTVYTKLDDGIEWYDKLVQKSNIPIINTVGNHDAYYGAIRTMAERKTVYDAIIAPVSVNVPGITQPTNAASLGLNYYYYDIGGIRIIVLDCMYWDSDQRTWFATVLSNARTNDIPVICVSHYNFLADYVDPVDCVWTPKTHEVGGGSMSMNSEPAIEVRTFQNNGGTFIAWLTGHSHGDTIKKLKSTFGSQYQFTFPSFANRASTLHKSDLDTDYNYDCFTYLVVDTNLGVLKGLRIGANISNEGTEHNGFVLDYINEVLVSAY